MLAVLTKCLGSPESPADDLTDDFTGWAGMNIFTLLMEIHEDLVKKPSRTIKPGYLGRYDAAQDRKKMCKHEQDMEDEIVVLELLPEFLKLSKARVPIPAQDELTAGLRKMMDAGKIDALPLYVVFASQAFLDIHHILREETIRPFQEIQETAKRVIDTVDAHFEFLHETMGGSWNDANLLRVRKFAKGWIQKDIIGPRFETEYKMKGVHQRSFFLLKIRPVLCGLWTYRMNTLLQECECCIDFYVRDVKR